MSSSPISNPNSPHSIVIFRRTASPGLSPHSNSEEDSSSEYDAEDMGRRRARSRSRDQEDESASSQNNFRHFIDQAQAPRYPTTPSIEAFAARFSTLSLQSPSSARASLADQFITAAIDHSRGSSHCDEAAEDPGAGGGGAAADREEGSSRDEPLNQFYLNGNLNKEALHRSFRNRFSFLRR